MPQLQPQFRLSPVGLWTIKAATFCKKRLGIKLPHVLVSAISNRSWRMRVGMGPWVPIRIDNTGRLVA